MLNLKQLRMVRGLTIAATLLLGFTGCETSSPDERSDGRVVDDKEITQTVQKELKHEPVYKFGGVDVDTFGGVVQLSGFVNTDDQKRRAEEIARSTPGVRQVNNGISLKPEPMASPGLAPTGTTNSATPPRIYSE